MHGKNLFSILKNLQGKVEDRLVSEMSFYYQISHCKDNGKFQVVPFSENVDSKNFKKFLGILYLIFKEALEQLKSKDFLPFFQVKIEKSENENIFLKLRIPTFELIIDCPSKIFETIGSHERTLKELEEFAKEIEDFKEKDISKSFKQAKDLYNKVANYIESCKSNLLDKFILFRLLVDLRYYYYTIVKSLTDRYGEEISYYIVYGKDGNIKLKKENKTQRKDDIVFSLPGIPLVTEFFENKNEHEIEFMDFFEKNDKRIEEFISDFATAPIEENLPRDLKLVSKNLKNLRNAIFDLDTFRLSLDEYCEEAQCVLADLILLEEAANSNDYFLRAFKMIKEKRENDEDIEDMRKEITKKIKEIQNKKDVLSESIRNLEQVNKTLTRIQYLLLIENFSTNNRTEQLNEYIELLRKLETYLNNSTKALEELIDTYQES